jgi:hypothetical protein
MSFEEELRATLIQVGDALEAVGAEWAIGGSFASTVHGEPRATNDVDFIATLGLAEVVPFVRALGSLFYADEQMIRAAVRARDSFNIIDERSFLKVDVFVPSAGPLGYGQLARRRPYALTEDGPEVFVLGPEDTILQKLRWYDLGGRSSDRQWRDIAGVIRVSRQLDLSYLRDVAKLGGLSELLESALESATAK